MGTDPESTPRDKRGLDSSCVADIEMILRSQESMFGADSKELADTLTTLSHLYWTDDSFNELAEAHFLRALEIKTKFYALEGADVHKLVDKLIDYYTRGESFKEVDCLIKYRDSLCAKAEADACKKTVPIDKKNIDEPPVTSRAEDTTYKGSLLPSVPTTTAAIAAVPKASPAPTPAPAPASAAVNQQKTSQNPILAYMYGSSPNSTDPHRKPASCLIVGPEKTLVNLGKFSLFIGTASHNDVCLPKDGVVEKFQAAITCDGSDYLLADQSTAKTTLLNNRPLSKPTKITRGDVIKVGTISIRVE